MRHYVNQQLCNHIHLNLEYVTLIIEKNNDNLTFNYNTKQRDNASSIIEYGHETYKRNLNTKARTYNASNRKPKSPHLNLVTNEHKLIKLLN